MNVLLIGGAGSFIDNLIVKMKKEGHRVYLLTGSKIEYGGYQKVFEKYNFTYDSSSLPEVFESINPDLLIYMGAYDTNYSWIDENRDGVKYSAGLLNILMAYASRKKGRFIYLSSHEVFQGDFEEPITEETKPNPESQKGLAIAQGEQICELYQQTRMLDIITLRLDHLYGIPKNRKDVRSICEKMCLQALEENSIDVGEENIFSLIYQTDAIEYIYRTATNKKHNYNLYHISSMKTMNQLELAEEIKGHMGEKVLIHTHGGPKQNIVLNRQRFESEFGNPFFCEVSGVVKKITDFMEKNRYMFLTGAEENLSLHERILKKAGWLIRTMIPFIENLIMFIPAFMLNNRAVGSQYFANLDSYQLYVLLFAIVYGQQQAVFSAVLAVAGYCFRQMYGRSGFEVMLDANTYVWMAHLFILGLVVGYMRDQIKKLKVENIQEREFLSTQLVDIQDINGSNVRVKDALETQIVNQNDSVAKIYSITSALDQYSSEEVLFYAAEMLSKLMKSKDVCIYTISNGDYARLFSFTSDQARVLGNSIRYPEMEEMYVVLKQQKVYINRKMDERYPMMANAIFENEKMQMILMVWTLPWERMTLGQANQLVVISALIQNAVLRANRYLSALEDQRYMQGTHMLEQEAFVTLMNAYLTARSRGLTECAALRINTPPETYREAGIQITKKLRQSDYLGIFSDGGLYALLANTSKEDVQFVINRFAEIGYESFLMEDSVE